MNIVANAKPAVVINTPWYEDKSLYVTILTPLLAPLVLWVVAKTGIEFDSAKAIGFIAGIAATAVAYIIGNKAKTAVISKAAIEAGAAVVDNPKAAASVTDA